MFRNVARLLWLRMQARIVCARINFISCFGLLPTQRVHTFRTKLESWTTNVGLSLTIHSVLLKFQQTKLLLCLIMSCNLMCGTLSTFLPHSSRNARIVLFAVRTDNSNHAAWGSCGNRNEKKVGNMGQHFFERVVSEWNTPILKTLATRVVEKIFL
jgi:hypothetical protein